MQRQHDGQLLSHFECEAGPCSKPIDLPDYFECDCRPRYASRLTMSATLRKNIVIIACSMVGSALRDPSLVPASS